jgi:tetratricopeptide (TPR) repeat protein
MDREHRHDLEQNDLEQFLANFGEWRKKYGATTLLWIMVIVLAVVGWNLYGNITQSSHDNAWNDLAGTTSPEGFQRVAEDHGDETVTVLASLWGGDAALTSALAPSNGEAAPDADAMLAQAEAMYQQILNQTGEPVYRISAILGLAAVAETRGDFEQAAQRYDQAIALAEPTYTALAQRAQQRKQMLDRLDEPVIFAPPVPQAEAAAPQEAQEQAPQEQPQTAEEPAPEAESEQPDIE